MMPRGAWSSQVYGPSLLARKVVNEKM